MWVAYSPDKRTEWRVAEGCWTETSPGGHFTYGATYTKLIKDLLMACSEEIDRAAEQELMNAAQVLFRSSAQTFTAPQPEKPEKDASLEKPTAGGRIVHTPGGDI